MECFNEPPHGRKKKITRYIRKTVALLSVENKPKQNNNKKISLQPNSIQLVIKMNLKTLNIDELQLFYYLLVMDIISSSLVGQIKKLNGLHTNPRPFFAHFQHRVTQVFRATIQKKKKQQWKKKDDKKKKKKAVLWYSSSVLGSAPCRGKHGRDVGAFSPAT